MSYTHKHIHPKHIITKWRWDIPSNDCTILSTMVVIGQHLEFLKHRVSLCSFPCMRICVKSRLATGAKLEHQGTLFLLYIATCAASMVGLETKGYPRCGMVLPNPCQALSGKGLSEPGWLSISLSGHGFLSMADLVFPCQAVDSCQCQPVCMICGLTEAYCQGKAFSGPKVQSFPQSQALGNSLGKSLPGFLSSIQTLNYLGNLIWWLVLWSFLVFLAR